MLKMISSFFETSIASLSIYDVFIILLFILAIVLSIISGIIVVSSSVKKINVELNKNKNVQSINDKIIQNRLDLIISKLVNNQNNYENKPNLIDLNNISNSNIKQAINQSENIHNEDLSSSASNVIKLPPPQTLETTESTDGFDVIKQPNENTNVFKNNNENNQDFNTNIVLSTDNIPKDSNYKDDDSIIEHNPETININAHQIPENLFDKNHTNNDDEIIVNIKDDFDKKTNLKVDFSSEESKAPIKINNNTTTPSYESNNIPLTPNNKLESLVENNKSTNGENEEDNGEITYSKNKEHKSKGIDLANKILNQIQAFSDEEKFEIVNYITDDGYYINCLVNNKLFPINFKELNTQLLIHRLYHQYEYPLDLIEANYPIELPNGSIKKCDAVIFDKDNNPYIICIIDDLTQNKKLNLLRKLVAISEAPFGLIINEQKMHYYQSFNNDIEEISDIPAFNENLDNYYENNHSKAQFISTPKSNWENSKYYSSYNSSIDKQNDPNYFSKDKYNIYKKNPYNLSNEYQSIIEKYRNLSSSYQNIYSNFKKIYDNNNYHNSNENTFLSPTNTISNNLRLNLINNNFRDPYMNRYNNVYPGYYPQPRPNINHIPYNNQQSYSPVTHNMHYNHQGYPQQPTQFNINNNPQPIMLNRSPYQRAIPSVNHHRPMMPPNNHLPAAHNINKNLYMNSRFNHLPTASDNAPSNISFPSTFKAYRDLTVKAHTSPPSSGNRLFNSRFKFK